MTDLIDEVPERLRERFSAIIEVTDTFCNAHLNDEYREFCREMSAGLCQEGSPVDRGLPKSWAAGIVYAVGWVNFLSDPSFEPHMTAMDLAERIGVSQATIMAKSKIIREGFDLMRLDPDWTLPSRLDDNLLVWMLEVNGIVVDIRMMPREAQVVAFEKGLIPYVPADRGADAGGGPDHGSEIIGQIGR